MLFPYAPSGAHRDTQSGPLIGRATDVNEPPTKPYTPTVESKSASLAMGWGSVEARPAPHGIGSVAATLDLLNGSLYTGNPLLPASCGEPYSIGVGRGGMLFIACLTENSVVELNPANRELLASAQVGLAPDGIAYDIANGDLYVLNENNNNVSILNGATLTSLGAITVGNSPDGIAYDPANGDLFVATWGSFSVDVISGANNSLFKTIDTGGELDGVVYDNQNGEVYAEDYSYGKVHVINASTYGFVTNVSVGENPVGGTFDASNGNIYITDSVSGAVSVINGSSNSVATTITVGSDPVDAAFDASNGDIYVSNDGSDSVSVINGTTSKVVTTLSVGAEPVSIAYDSPSGNTYVVNFRDGNLSVISGATNRVTTAICVGTDSQEIAFDQTSGNLYVSNYASQNVSVVSGRTDQVLTAVPGLQYSIGVSSNDGDEIYVGSEWDSEISEINATTNKVASTFSVYGNPWGIAYDPKDPYILEAMYYTSLTGGPQYAVGLTDPLDANVTWYVGVGKEPEGVAYDNATGYVYSANSGANTVSVIDPSTQTVSATISVGTSPNGVTFNATSGEVYVTDSGSNNVTVINRTSFLTNIHVGAGPEGAAFDPDNGYIYITDSGSDDVSVISGTSVIGTIPVGVSPEYVVFDPQNGNLYVVNTGASTISVISTASVGSLSTVVVTPKSANVSLNGTQAFSGIPTCTGIPCASGVTYSWSLTKKLGTLNSTSGKTVLFTAGAKVGNLSLFVNATLNGTTRMAGPIPITITPSNPTLASVSVSPSSAALLVNGTQSFSASPTCTGGPCPAGATYAWHLNNAIGSLNSTTGSSVYFTASTSPGSGVLYLNASLNGVTKPASPVPITVSASGSSFLTSVSTSPPSAVVSVNGTQAFTATPVCTSACPGTVTYAWTLSNGLGSVSPMTGPSVNFSAGPSVGSVQLTVSATLNGVTKAGSAGINITRPTPTLSSIAISPTDITIGIRNSTSLTASPECTGGTCPSGTVYSWSLQNTSLGNLNAGSGPEATFTAGNTAGSEIVFAMGDLNGVQQSGLAVLNITKGAVPTLTSLTLTPSPTALIQLRHSQTFNATPSCSVGPCPSGIIYTWVLNNSLGNLSSKSGASVVLTAGGSDGALSLTVTAQLNGGSKTSTSDITITSSVVPVITEVTISPGSSEIQVDQVRGFTANATCSPGPCPGSTTYEWALNNSLGSVSPLSGSSTQFTAGSSTGSVTLRVNATFNGKSVTNSITIMITQAKTPPGNQTPLPTFLGLPGYEGYILLIVIVAAVVVAVVIALTRRKKSEAIPHPSAESQEYPEHPGYPQQPPYPPGH